MRYFIFSGPGPHSPHTWPSEKHRSAPNLSLHPPLPFPLVEKRTANGSSVCQFHSLPGRARTESVPTPSAAYEERATGIRRAVDDVKAGKVTIPLKDELLGVKRFNSYLDLKIREHTLATIERDLRLKEERLQERVMVDLKENMDGFGRDMLNYSKTVYMRSEWEHEVTYLEQRNSLIEIASRQDSLRFIHAQDHWQAERRNLRGRIVLLEQRLRPLKNHNGFFVLLFAFAQVLVWLSKCATGPQSEIRQY